MAYNLNNIDNFRKEVYNGGMIFEPILKIGDEIVPIINIEQMSLSDPVINPSDSVFYLGSFVSKELKVTFRNYQNLDLTSKIELSVKTELNNQEVTIPIGKFNIETSPEDYYQKSEIIALDDGVLFKKNINLKNIVEPPLDEEGKPTTNEKSTVENVLKFICDQIGVELGTYPDVNKNVILNSYDNTISGKQYVSWIAEIMGSNAKIGRDGKLYIIPLKQSPVSTIDALNGSSWVKSNEYEISSVKIDYANGISITKPEQYNAELNELPIRSDNMFISGSNEEIGEIINNIANSVVGTKLTSLSTNHFGDITLDGTDIVTYKVGNDEYQSFYSPEFTFNGSIMVKNDVKLPNKNVEQTTNVVGGGNEKEVIKRLQVLINQQDNYIRQLAKRTGDLETADDGLRNSIEQMVNISNVNEYVSSALREVGDYYTKDQIDLKLKGQDEQGNNVEKVVTTNATLDIDGLTVASTQNSVKNRVAPNGMSVTKTEDGTEVFYAGYDETRRETVVRTNNLNVSTYLNIGDKSRFQEYTRKSGELAIGCFWRGE